MLVDQFAQSRRHDAAADVAEGEGAQRPPMLLEVARRGRIGAVAQHALFGFEILLGDTSKRQLGLGSLRLGLGLVGAQNTEPRLREVLAGDLGRVFQ